MIAILPSHITAEIDAWTQKFPPTQRQSAVLYALTLVQKENGYLTESLMNAVAAYLNMPRIAVYEVASFYTLYDLAPVGRYKIAVCTNISCMLRGSEDIVEHLKHRLNIGINETTQDGRFTLKAVECLAACGGAPMMHIGDHYYENLTPDRVDHILSDLK